MLTLLAYAFLAAVAVGALYWLALLVLPNGEQMAPPAPDTAPWALSTGPLHAPDVVRVRLPVALRGYRFAETDELLDRLAEELRRRDEEIDWLRRGAVAEPAHGARPRSPIEP